MLAHSILLALNCIVLLTFYAPRSTLPHATDSSKHLAGKQVCRILQLATASCRYTPAAYNPPQIVAGQPLQCTACDTHLLLNHCSLQPATDSCHYTLAVWCISLCHKSSHECTQRRHQYATDKQNVNNPPQVATTKPQLWGEL